MLMYSHKAYVFCDRCQMKSNGNDTKTRDQARVENECKLLIQADKLTEMIILNVPEKYAIDN
jgi:hypothetical protein